MTTPTPWPTPTDFSSFASAGQFVNTSTGGLWAPGLLVTFFGIMLLAFSAWPLERRFAAASWLAMVGAFFFQALNLIGWSLTGVFIGLAALGTLVLLVFK